MYNWLTVIAGNLTHKFGTNLGLNPNGTDFGQHQWTTHKWRANDDISDVMDGCFACDMNTYIYILRIGHWHIFGEHFKWSHSFNEQAIKPPIQDDADGHLIYRTGDMLHNRCSWYYILMQFIFKHKQTKNNYKCHIDKLYQTIYLYLLFLFMGQIVCIYYDRDSEAILKFNIFFCC